ncbi:MAG: hypothetical protein HBSAPP04_23510 [Ignavibacteriaceae bacterium]|nr:MAG: hypothetical protein HBSAPP04_23510 [Ignavibacteriaceae bacterium]
MRKNLTTIDEYISEADESVRGILQQMRGIIAEASPGTTECISYGMPAFRLRRVVVYFAAFKNHVSLFPGASGVATFADELKQWKWSKGTIQFPLDQPLPVELIKRIVAFRLKEETERDGLRKNT